TNDLYKRFMATGGEDNESERGQKKMVGAGRLATILIMLIALFVTTQLDTIKSAWEFILGCGAGLGMVLMLRWYWWRISALTELVATITPFAGYAFSRLVLEPKLGPGFTANNGSFFFTVSITSVCWILVTILFPSR